MSNKIVKIYSTPTCHFCNEAKDYFSEKGISFENINLVGNPEKIAEVRKLSGASSVPVIVIGDKVLIGFNRFAVDSALASSA